MDLKDEYKSLEPSLRRRIRRVTIISVVWASLILGSAGIFHSCKPWLDKRRLEREALLAAQLEEEKDSELLKTWHWNMFENTYAGNWQPTLCIYHILYTPIV